MDRERIENLLEILKSSTAQEIAVREGDQYIRLRREAPVAGSGAEDSAEAAAPGVPGPVPPGEAPPVLVTARLVGLFHRGEQPDGEPLVEVGDRVTEGQRIATIESLRQLTGVTAPVNGTVLEIAAEENQAVEYGHVLLVLSPDTEE